MNPHITNPIGTHPISGEFVAFSDYLERTKRERPVSVLWKWSEIAQNLERFPAGERGSIALGHCGGGNSLSAAPGLSTTVQVVAAGARTKSHAHSFWHLYIVRSGNGLFFANEDDEGSSLAAGDILFIPACTMHSFSNLAGEEPLILFAIQDLPHVAELGVLARQEAGGPLELVYS
jgi:gentisate 1,2-dioxygenase